MTHLIEFLVDLHIFKKYLLHGKAERVLALKGYMMKVATVDRYTQRATIW